MMDMYALLMGGSGGGGGSDSSVVVVHDVEGTLDKTWAEINNAVANNKIVFCVYYSSSDGETNGWFAYLCAIGGGDRYSVVFFDGSDPLTYECATEDGYPELV